MMFFTDLMSKEMTRKEFLLHLGLILLAVSGITGLLRTLGDPQSTNHKNSGGFGGSTYGGIGKGRV